MGINTILYPSIIFQIFKVNQESIFSTSQACNDGTIKKIIYSIIPIQEIEVENEAQKERE